MEVGASSQSERSAQTVNFDYHPFGAVRPLIVLLALALTGCGDKPGSQAAPAAPPVTVSQPTRRTVTDWDEFTGRFEAIEEVQVRARVGGFVTNVVFRDGALSLNQTQAVSDAVVDQRRQALQAAKAAEMQAEGLLKAAQLNIEFSHVVAAIAGRVSRHLVSIGNLVQGSDAGGGTLLTSIVSLDPIHIYFDMDEATYQRNN